MSIATAKIHASISQVEISSWNDRVRSDSTLLRHEFLSAIEKSASDAGLRPACLVMHGENRQLIAAATLCLSHDGAGDHWPDAHWAAACARAGKRYYPKLIVGAPFTPAEGPRLLLAPDIPDAAARLVRTLEEAARRAGAGSIHIPFVGPDDRRALTAAGWPIRQTHQYRWRNDDYDTFDHFLSALTKRKRDLIKTERRRARDAGLTYLSLTGPDIKPAHLDTYFDLVAGMHQERATPFFLRRDFFHRLRDTLADRLLLTLALEDGVAVAGVLSILSDGGMHVRHWGRRGFRPFVHFEACYYRSVDFAIERRLRFIGGGYGGEHKPARGFDPHPVHCGCWFPDPSVMASAAGWIEAENAVERERLAAARRRSAYAR